MFCSTTDIPRVAPRGQRRWVRDRSQALPFQACVAGRARADWTGLHVWVDLNSVAAHQQQCCGDDGRGPHVWRSGEPHRDSGCGPRMGCSGMHGSFDRGAPDNDLEH